MKIRALSFTAVLVFAGSAGFYARAHQGDHPKYTAKDCKKVLDESTQQECLACVQDGKHHFHQSEPAGKRCFANETKKK